MRRIQILPLLAVICCIPRIGQAQAPEAFEPAAKAVNHLAVPLGKQLLARPANTVFSPWSVQTTLAMAWTGAAGATEKEMGSVLGLSGEREAVSASFKRLRSTLTGPRPKETPAVIQAASHLFIQDEYVVDSAWEDLLKDRFGAGVESLPFRDNSAGAFARINTWVKENTGGRITDLFPPRNTSAITRLVLVDAVYFNVPWQAPFERNLTRLNSFFVSKGHTRKTPFMNAERYMSYGRRGGFQMVALPYAARDLQFVAIIPDKGDGLSAIVAGLTPELLTACTRLKSELVALAIPKIHLKPPPVSLEEPLRTIGLSKALSPGEADFSGITKNDPRLFISRVRQCAWLEMDESGTRAAAATEAGAEPFGAAAAPKPIVVRADRPFLFIIQHVPSATCLFMGCVTDPGGPGMAIGK